MRKGGRVGMQKERRIDGKVIAIDKRKENTKIFFEKRKEEFGKKTIRSRKERKNVWESRK